jgi:hypothetical protein
MLILALSAILAAGLAKTYAQIEACEREYCSGYLGDCHLEASTGVPLTG